MIIIFGLKTEFKREGAAGQLRCPNCGHVAPQTLCRQFNKPTLFFIPIARFTKQRGTMCENCGVIRPMSKREYRDKKQLGLTSSSGLGPTGTPINSCRV